jgi:hypothetical protein
MLTRSSGSRVAVEVGCQPSLFVAVEHVNLLSAVVWQMAYDFSAETV